jgi:hypothetical protein
MLMMSVRPVNGSWFMHTYSFLFLDKRTKQHKITKQKNNSWTNTLMLLYSISVAWPLVSSIDYILIFTVEL